MLRCLVSQVLPQSAGMAFDIEPVVVLEAFMYRRCLGIEAPNWMTGTRSGALLHKAFQINHCKRIG